MRLSLLERGMALSPTDIYSFPRSQQRRRYSHFINIFADKRLIELEECSVAVDTSNNNKKEPFD
jgi:hypothetical protein